MNLHSTILYLSVFIMACSAYRLSHFESHEKSDPRWESQQLPERDFLYRNFGILDNNIQENPQGTPPPPRPYVGPKNGKYKYKKKKRPNPPRPDEETSEPEAEEDY